LMTQGEKLLWREGLLATASHSIGRWVKFWGGEALEDRCHQRRCSISDWGLRNRACSQGESGEIDSDRTCFNYRTETVTRPSAILELDGGPQFGKGHCLGQNRVVQGYQRHQQRESPRDGGAKENMVGGGKKIVRGKKDQVSGQSNDIKYNCSEIKPSMKRGLQHGRIKNRRAE